MIEKIYNISLVSFYLHLSNLLVVDKVYHHYNILQYMNCHLTLFLNHYPYLLTDEEACL